MNYNLDTILSGYSKRSKYELSLAFKDFTNYLEKNNASLEALKEQDVYSYIAYLENRQLSSQTIRAKLYYLSNILQKLIDNKIVCVPNFFKNISKTSELLTVGIDYYVSPEDIATLIRYADDMLKLIILLTLKCALTSGEIISIKRKDIVISPEYTTISLVYKSKEKYIVVPFDIKDEFDTYYSSVSSEYLFVNKRGQQLSRTVLERNFNKLVNGCSLSNITLKKIRGSALIRANNCNSDEYVIRRTGISKRVLDLYKVPVLEVADGADIHDLMFVKPSSGLYDIFRIYTKLYSLLPTDTGSNFKIYTDYVDSLHLIAFYTDDCYSVYYQGLFLLLKGHCSCDTDTIIKAFHSNNIK